jgi:hypothetical protein
VNDSTVQEIRGQVRGELITPADPSYEAARNVYNGVIDRRLAAADIDVARARRMVDDDVSLLDLRFRTLAFVFRSWEAGSERPYRELPRPLPERVPERIVVPDPWRTLGGASRRGAKATTQCVPTAPWAT